MESVCAELLLSGLLVINNKNPDFDRRTSIFYANPKVVYVVPDPVNIRQINCRGNLVTKKKAMSAMIRKVD